MFQPNKFNMAIIILFFIFCTNYIQNVNSQTPEIEYDCLFNLFTNINQISEIPTDSRFQFCSATNLISCDTDGLVIRLKLVQTDTVYSLTDLSCYIKLQKLEIVDSIITNNLFYDSLPLSLTEFSISTSRPTGYTYYQLPSQIKTFNTYTLDQPQQMVQFSWLKDLNYFTMSTKLFEGFGSNLISFDNDLTIQPSWMGDFKITSINFPSFDNVNNMPNVVLATGYDQVSLANNIATSVNVQSLSIYAFDLSTFPLSSSYRNNRIFDLTINMPLRTPTSMIDLSLIGDGLQNLYIQNPGVDFTLNGLGTLPIIIPTNNNFVRFTYSGGGLANLNFEQYKTAKELVLRNNQISDSLSVWDTALYGTKLTTLQLSGNQITGTIDDSYCGLDLDVSNNLLTGRIPDCFTVFFGLSNINLESSFAGNSFDNLNTPSSPSLIIPNIIFNGTNGGGVIFEFLIYGENLGARLVVGSIDNAIANGITGNFLVLIPNKLLIMRTVYAMPPSVIHLAYSSTNQDYNFTLSWDPLKPQLTTVDWVTSELNLILNGSFFSYNTSIIKIMVDGEPCVVLKSSFYQIACIFGNTIDNSLDNIVTFISVGNLTTQITLNPGILNVVINCTENYNDCNGNGYCQTDVGQCDCFSTHYGPSCEFLNIACPNNCSGNGSCSGQTGVCTCLPGFQRDDCGIPFIECPSVNVVLCNGHGQCNNQTGQCGCENSFQGIDCSLPFIPCLNNCNGNGVCLNQTGQCSCENSFQGIDCSLPFIPCLNNCNGNGVCFNQTGQCGCENSFQGIDCGLPFIPCLNNCNNHGQCNNVTGNCLCPYSNPNSWVGVDCSTPLHFVSSVYPSNTNGGDATFFGWFGNIHRGLEVYIGDKQCTPIINQNENEITCIAPAGTGIHSIKVIQNTLNFNVSNFYQYIDAFKSCPNDCTSNVNGKCNTTSGFCQCFDKWYGYDCSLYSNDNGNGNGGGSLPNTNTTIDDNGNTNLNNQQTNYQISITKLIEIGLNGNVVNEFTLRNKWSVKSNSIVEGNGVFKFIQSIQNDICNITYTIEEIGVDRNASFAGIDFQLKSGSVKMTVSIERYQFTNNLNTLQLHMETTVNEIETNDRNDCNDDSVEINSISYGSSLNYISIKKDSKVLVGRLLDRIESDGKSTYVTSEIISKSENSVVIAANLPHCVTNCLLDPDFSVLLSTEFKSECGTTKKSWLLPIAIIIPVAGVSCIVAAALLIYRKKKIEDPLKAQMKAFQNKK